MRRDFGLIAPPVSLHAVSPPVLAAAWVLLRETLVADGAGRTAKEVVATGVSEGNSCRYCAEIHGRAVAELAGAGHAEGRRLADWARGTAGPGALPPAPCAAADLPGVMGTAITFHYLNRMVEVFLPPSPVPSAAPPAVRRRIVRLLTAATVREVPPARPGESLELLPDAPLPPEFRWAAPSPVVAGALARAAAAVDAAAAGQPSGVRDLVTAEIPRRAGSPPPLGRAWSDDAVADLAAADRPAARLALLTALAAPQVLPADIAAVRARHPDPADLLHLTAWAAMAAARDVAARLPAAPADPPFPRTTEPEAT
jgi:AhpD family alkylhydroperoxidase